MTKEERMNSARQLHDSGYNCCQSVVLAYADLLPIEKKLAKDLSAPFGAGLSGCREVCGCVSGMAIVCGLTGHNADVRSLIERFREMNGDIVCHRLREMNKKPCLEMITDAAGLLFDVLV